MIPLKNVIRISCLLQPLRVSSLCSKNMSSNRYLVFVYGTLKRSEPNHDWISNAAKGHAKFIGKAQTVKKYPLIIASQYNIPFMLQVPGQGENVIGEIYEVNDLMLSNLDILEEHPSFYVRELDQVEILDENVGNSKETLDCWIYFLKTFKESLLQEEKFREYSSNGTHGKVYTPRYLRDGSFKQQILK